MKTSEIQSKMNEIFEPFFGTKIFMWIMFIIITYQYYSPIVSQTVDISHSPTINISENIKPDL